MALRIDKVTTPDRERANESFDRLFVQEYRRVVAIAYRVLNDAAEAEDVAQDVFVSFSRRHHPDAPFASAWLHRAASHLALNTLRSQRRRGRRERDDATSQARLQDVQARSLDPSESLDLSEDRRQVRQVLGRLPSRSAKVLALRYSGLSYAEVAAALGCGVGQIGTLLRRAEEAFRKEMNRETR